MPAPRLSDLIMRDVSPDPEILGVTADSRKVGPGFLFAALPGAKVDGRSFAGTAVAGGAAAILACRCVDGLPVPVVQASDPRRAYALAAAAFYGRQPATVVAVTGTNGKTSVATFCRQIFAAAGHSAASMGTLGVQVGDEALAGPGLTTPDAAEVARLMAELAGRSVTHVALEASSHGLEQRRLDGVRLAAAGFTNLSQDHLDYHGTMGAYRAAKLRLFEALLPRGAQAVLNADSDAFPAFAAATATFGHTLIGVGAMGEHLTLAARTPEAGGQRLKVRAWGREHELRLPLVGAFQAANALVAAGLAIAGGVDPEAALNALERLRGAAGRLQHVGGAPSGGQAYVDYAHTPDGLATVLAALRPHAAGRLIVVMGAGGDRDRGKRPMMGAVAAREADIAIVTDDNPRSEPPEMIRAEVMAGGDGLIEIADRSRAIACAVAMLEDGDVLVVAGKGHEQGQIIGTEVLPFDDAEVLGGALRSGTHG
ncbi:MAG: UDP-N-acetylmuramoyl-L-alanyl-D-glutamate--2,6-diaminopimelate ligase [Caulobacteraceae bacterium]|nr:UDP-N-acetylmuramoyl-L-alanyl-D-glutamate--2,6-diaminopimelate ligase [Caulobacteraceae bacterium]